MSKNYKLDNSGVLFIEKPHERIRAAAVNNMSKNYKLDNSGVLFIEKPHERIRAAAVEQKNF